MWFDRDWSTEKSVLYMTAAGSVVLLLYSLLRYTYLEHTAGGRNFCKQRRYSKDPLPVILAAVWSCLMEVSVLWNSANESMADASHTMCVVQATGMAIFHLALVFTLAMITYDLYNRLIHDTIPVTANSHLFWAMFFPVLSAIILCVFAEVKRLPMYCIFFEPSWLMYLVFYSFVFILLVLGTFWAYKSIKAIFSAHTGSIALHLPSARGVSNKRYFKFLWHSRRVLGYWVLNLIINVTVVAVRVIERLEDDPTRTPSDKPGVIEYMACSPGWCVLFVFFLTKSKYVRIETICGAPSRKKPRAIVLTQSNASSGVSQEQSDAPKPASSYIAEDADDSNTITSSPRPGPADSDEYSIESSRRSTIV
jgi:hypothetical protein